MNLDTDAQSARARHKARTRDALLDAALELFGERGYDDTTVDEIAAAAGVSRRTFFRYFPTKEAVVFARQAERLESFRELAADPRPGESPFACLARALVTLGNGYVSDPQPVVEVQRMIDASPVLQARERQIDLDWDQAVFEALARRAETPDQERDARIFAGAVVGAVRATLRIWIDSGGRLDLIALGRRTLRMLGGAQA